MFRGFVENGIGVCPASGPPTSRTVSRGGRRETRRSAVGRGRPRARCHLGFGLALAGGVNRSDRTRSLRCCSPAGTCTKLRLLQSAGWSSIWFTGGPNRRVGENEIELCHRHVRRSDVSDESPTDECLHLRPGLHEVFVAIGTASGLRSSTEQCGGWKFGNGQCTRYMSSTSIPRSARERSHADSTARWLSFQTFELIQSWFRSTVCPMFLVNTSPISASLS